MNVNLYTFSKKINSTARPGGADKTCSCTLKEPCGILNPEIALNLGLTDSPFSYNYAYISEFDRYYYVKEWTFQNALWYASLEVDPLASWKDSIGASSCYVLRSSHESDGTILDNTYPANASSTYEEGEGVSPWNTGSLASGSYIVGVAGENTSYYIFTQSELSWFLSQIMSDDYLEQIVPGGVDTFPELKAQANPLQFITKIMWLPFVPSGDYVEDIKVGFGMVYAPAHKMTSSGIYNNEISNIIKRHPQAESRGFYLNNAPYSHYSLFFPPWGMITLDPDMIANTSSIKAKFCVDLRTGLGTLRIYCGDTFEHLLSWTHSQVGIDHQVSQVINKGFGSMATIGAGVGMLSNLASGNVAGAISGGVSAIGDYARSKIPSATTIGSDGGMNSLLGTPAIIYEWKHVVEEDNAHRGRPLCKNKTISTVPGYVQVANAYISISATQSEKNSIISFMEGGFYYE